MSKKQLGLDGMGIQKTMRLGDYLADSGGQFALNSISGLIGAKWKKDGKLYKLPPFSVVDFIDSDAF